MFRHPSPFHFNLLLDSLACIRTLWGSEFKRFLGLFTAQLNQKLQVWGLEICYLNELFGAYDINQSLPTATFGDACKTT